MSVANVNQRIDFHCHILPGVDDGAPSLEEALVMARLAIEDGTGTIVATPHALASRYNPSPNAVAEAFDRLSAALEENQIPLRLHRAAEVYFVPDLLARVEARPSLTVNGERKYLLTELPFVGYPTFVAEVCFDLLLHGIVPIIAHPERSQHLQQHPHLLYELVSQGVMAQVNAGSLLGYFGPEVQGAAMLFLRHRLIHVLGSDGHDSHRRPPLLGQAVLAVAQVCGEEYAHNVAAFWPSKILAGDYVQVAEPEPIKHRGSTHSPNRGPGEADPPLWRRIFFRRRTGAQPGA